MNKVKRKTLLETDLYQPIYNYLIDQGYSVNSEVNYCDVIARKGEELIIIEIKRQLNMKLLIQAAKRQRMVDFVYVAIPRSSVKMNTRNWRDTCFLLRRLELGLIIVSISNKRSGIEIVFHPSPFQQKKSKALSQKKRAKLTMELDGRHGNYNVGGSWRRKIMTAYKENVIQIACFLEAYGSLSPHKLKKLGSGSKTTSILSKNFYGWFEKVKHGVYALNDKGKKELKEFPELVSYFKKEIKEE